MKQVTAIVVAAGLGKRFRSKVPKPLVKVNSKPLLVYSLEALNNHPCVRDIIVVVNSLNSAGIERCIRKYGISKVRNIVLGGRARKDSVRCGLKASDDLSGLVLIHDAARPFINKDIITRVVKEAQKYKAAIAGVPVKATIKETYGTPLVRKTLNRERLWEVQTPQVFDKALILGAYAKFGYTKVTDDASLVEKLGARVRVVMGSYFNIKITTPEDLILAQVIACQVKSA